MQAADEVDKVAEEIAVTIGDRNTATHPHPVRGARPKNASERFRYYGASATR
jgi:hypothetical protein